MRAYRCPQCGRDNLEIQHGSMAEPDTIGTQTVLCKSCGWFGSVEDLDVYVQSEL